MNQALGLFIDNLTSEKNEHFKKFHLQINHVSRWIVDAFDWEMKKVEFDIWMKLSNKWEMFTLQPFSPSIQKEVKRLFSNN